MGRPALLAAAAATAVVIVAAVYWLSGPRTSAAEALAALQAAPSDVTRYEFLVRDRSGQVPGRWDFGKQSERLLTLYPPDPTQTKKLLRNKQGISQFRVGGTRELERSAV